MEARRQGDHSQSYGPGDREQGCSPQFSRQLADQRLTRLIARIVDRTVRVLDVNRKRSRRDVDRRASLYNPETREVTDDGLTPVR